MGIITTMAKAKKNNPDTEIAIIANDVTYIKQEIEEIKKKLDAQYVTRLEFDSRCKSIDDKFSPGLKILYGIVTLVMTGVGAAILALVINTKK